MKGEVSALVMLAILVSQSPVDEALNAQTKVQQLTLLLTDNTP